jgi:Cdc6-like AAA superfamily ATPase
MLPPFLQEDSIKVHQRSLFVGREIELARLKEFLDLALQSKGSIAFVTGEAGSGKTALLETFTRVAEETDRDLLVAWGACDAYTGSGDPYLPFRDILVPQLSNFEG